MKLEPKQMSAVIRGVLFQPVGGTPTENTLKAHILYLERELTAERAAHAKTERSAAGAFKALEQAERENEALRKEATAAESRVAEPKHTHTLPNGREIVIPDTPADPRPSGMGSERPGMLAAIFKAHAILLNAHTEARAATDDVAKERT